MLENMKIVLMAICVVHGFVCIYGAIYPRKVTEFERRLYKSSEDDSLKKISGLLQPSIIFMSVDDKTIKEINGMRRQCIIMSISSILVLTVLFYS